MHRRVLHVSKVSKTPMLTLNLCICDIYTCSGYMFSRYDFMIFGQLFNAFKSLLTIPLELLC